MTDSPQFLKPLQRRCVLVCQHRSCLRNGSAEVLAAFQATVPNGVFASGSECMGQCASGTTVHIMPDNFWYCRIKPSDVPTIVQQHLWSDRPVESLLHPRFHPPAEWL
ncbi:MAG: (2Fe-2S) ferredoxin domain-containing protein [Drouetiella hepatica Uher 2000/2452]|jgi:(2Fe-2S) ferredoxin|uniref:(2Fe-2S) ferredoxin domain-containing protein n=1 Tax=Drouetiella hepatica Uher 2000/2452 TaxID=904376 RepID=A0A951Q982_9CYAN|nr:(2Fe-2S) ferredoxin domain-containing protein [Drouetiella hepatica Uher 2000/2452]